MKSYTKSWTIALPITLDEAWAFFSRPENLQHLAPASLKFKVLSDIAGTEMYGGMIIRYQVSPIWGLPLNWTTEITHCHSNTYFVDEQRAGPYALWHHEHHFIKKSSGIEMRDILTYALPWGYLGRLANQIFISKLIDHIFAYRKIVLQNKFQ